MSGVGGHEIIYYPDKHHNFNMHYIFGSRYFYKI